jgi:hypothetical protein
MSRAWQVFTPRKGAHSFRYLHLPGTAQPRPKRAGRPKSDVPLVRRIYYPLIGPINDPRAKLAVSSPLDSCKSVDIFWVAWETVALLYTEAAEASELFAEG